ncbi:hypothetical protein MMC11_001206 [Xylographa trunciseda]|nr:hypothetical protein [Xylographa trunciseda]
MPSLRRSLSTYSLRPPPTILGKRPQSVDLRTVELRPGRTELASSVSTTGTARSASEVGTNTAWKYANQGGSLILPQEEPAEFMKIGLSLLETAVQEAQSPDCGDQAFARQLYIHSVAYLLHGLPSDISEAEAASLRPGIAPLLQRDLMGCSNKRSSSGNRAASPPSLLHRLLASGIVQLFILFSFVLPYVQLYLRSAYRYERTNHVSERIFAAGIDTMDQVGRQGFGLAGSILNSSNGRIGGMLASTCAWFIDGISGGIRDGVGEGMAMMGNHQKTST